MTLGELSAVGAHMPCSRVPIRLGCSSTEPGIDRRDLYFKLWFWAWVLDPTTKMVVFKRCNISWTSKVRQQRSCTTECRSPYFSGGLLTGWSQAFLPNHFRATAWTVKHSIPWLTYLYTEQNKTRHMECCLCLPFLLPYPVALQRIYSFLFGWIL